MRRISVVGIGAGDPEHLTFQAARAIREADVVLLIDKGTAPELVALREELLRRHGSPDHRVVTVPDADRDRSPDDYGAAVRDWHAERAERLAAAIEAEVPDGGTGAFLVWGDPSLYDSTLRVLDRITTAGGLDLEVTVVPGVSALHALAAAHKVPLHGIGEPILVTTGRRLVEDFTPDVPSVVVLLDGRTAFTEVDPEGVEILWGAYLGTSDQVLVAGPLADVSDRIVAARTEARERLGWIMDSYLLRRTEADTT
jgi:precorrin-6A synthase